MEVACIVCGGSGLQVVERDGERFVRDCRCRLERRAARRVAAARIPERYRERTLDTFETDFTGATNQLKAAHLLARQFVDAYPIGTGGNGLLLVGPLGVGKTHLAIGILRALVVERGVNGLFVHYSELLKQVQNSYSRQVQATELEVLAPVFDAEVLVLDEVGAQKPTEWVRDTVAQILNTRYNDRRTTILTTNYVNAEPLGGSDAFDTNSAFAQARAAVRDETLGDRIGERIRSRLHEMCVIVEMTGGDFRKTVNRARFG